MTAVEHPDVLVPEKSMLHNKHHASSRSSELLLHECLVWLTPQPPHFQTSCPLDAGAVSNGEGASLTVHQTMQGFLTCKSYPMPAEKKTRCEIHAVDTACLACADIATVCFLIGSISLITTHSTLFRRLPRPFWPLTAVR